MKVNNIRRGLLVRIREKRCDNCNREMSQADKKCKICKEPNEDYRKFTGSHKRGGQKKT